MKSIQTKLIILITCCSFVTSLVVLAVGTAVGANILEENSITILSLECLEKAEEINNVLDEISCAVDLIASYAEEEMGDPEILWANEEKLDAYVEKVHEVCRNTAETTEGAVAVYMRFKEDLNYQGRGILMVENEGTGKFEDFELTDISQYAENDDEHVGWYYTPIKARRAVWLEPYNNKNLDCYMTSYVVPIKYDDNIIAVIGIDINMSFFIHQVSSVRIYESGYAFIWSKEGKLLYHPDYPGGLSKNRFSNELQNLYDKAFNSINIENSLNYFKWKNVRQCMHSIRLENGMIFTVAVPLIEIYSAVTTFAKYSFLLLIAVIGAAFLVTTQITGKIVKPIKELNTAAKKIAEGDLDVSIHPSTKDEIGVLGRNVGLMTERLKAQFDSIQKSARTDVMTGVWNKTAYEERVQKINEDIKKGRAGFSLVVLDVNNLKYVNDNLGHELGDRMIKDASGIMRRVFEDQDIYRTGGDEFVVVFGSSDNSKSDKLKRKFRRTIENFNLSEHAYDIDLHIACGGSSFEPESDFTYSEVFNRADQDMYRDKILIKLRTHTNFAR